MEFRIPLPLKAEHDELHNLLRQATQLPDNTGIAAKIVAKVMHPHFVKEEEYALPPLCLLPLIASGKISEEMKLILHAQTEEEVSYPTAILIGEYIKLKLGLK